jgi:nitrogen fixation protein FixH
MKAGAAWPAAIVAVLAVTVLANVALFWAANEPGAAAIEPDYYRRALAWDRSQASAARAARLGWHVQAAFGRPDRNGTPLAVTLSDALGAPVVGARVSVVGLHNLDFAHPLAWSLRERGSGRYETYVQLRHSGRWELRVSAECGRDQFAVVLHADASERSAR